MRLMTTLPSATAAMIVDKALEVGRSEDLKPLTVVVLDAGGKMIAMRSEDGSGLARFDIAFGKGWGALGMGISSRQIQDFLSSRPSFQAAISVASEGRFIPVPGGVLIETAEGVTIGAVGISGDVSDKDEYCAILAIRSVDMIPNPPEVDPNWRGAAFSDKT